MMVRRRGESVVPSSFGFADSVLPAPKTGVPVVFLVPNNGCGGSGKRSSSSS